jgi:hypothetical protein
LASLRAEMTLSVMPIFNIKSMTSLFAIGL